MYKKNAQSVVIASLLPTIYSEMYIFYINMNGLGSSLWAKWCNGKMKDRRNDHFDIISQLDAFIVIIKYVDGVLSCYRLSLCEENFAAKLQCASCFLVLLRKAAKKAICLVAKGTFFSNISFKKVIFS